MHGTFLATREVDIARCRSIAELRSLVDRAQLDLLGEILGLTMAHGTLPAAFIGSRFTRSAVYFRMHQALADILDARVRAPQ